MAIAAHAVHVNAAKNKTMKITKETLRQIIKEELDAVMEDTVTEAGGRLMAYFNPSMMKGDTAVELQYDGKKIDFRYRFARPDYDPFKIQKAVQSLADGGKLGSINGLAEAIFDVLNRKMGSDKPTLEQVKNMKVYFG